MKTIVDKPKQEGGIKWSEALVFAKLASLFPSPAFCLLPQVRNATGFARRVRTADGLVVSTWPSRGLYFAGIEIKVSKSDWKHERANAEKSVEIQRFCRYWYLAVPQGLVSVGEVPATWGLIEVTHQRAIISKPAPELEFDPPTMGFVCSLLRSVQAATVPAAEVHARIDEVAKLVKEGEQRNRNYAFDDLQAKVKAFEEASGVTLGAPWENDKIGRAVKMVLDTSALGVQAQMQRLRDQAARIVELADAGLRADS